ncbi:ABC transporter substrate-binding protein [Agromyces atrinae]|uniref:Thiamine pyrimidine synthase n=1 Tax=Agromyces atrinae TaxID=592376 RepID=A0A4Q2MCM1_9MICO|nr:ABC transporter substrate-binding protein [Agromyces atrinae]NYD68057.1 NitT/TauT family transport system substrate-binding protein [Agromyces atrinae]RXZ87792.1 ABC transporter substrate-binding protein [Agromyces atrinae]
MHKHFTMRRSAAALAAAGVALSLTACGGMGEATEPAAVNENCETVDDVTVVLQWVTQAQFAGYYAAVDNGTYADYCLDVTIQEGGTNVVPQQVLASGNAQFAVSHVVKSMASRQEGADIVNIGQVFERGAYLQVSWADSGIGELSDLAGTTMGSWGGGNELTLYSALRASGVDPATDITVVQQPFDMSMLLNREADSVQAKTYNEFAQLLETINPDTGELYTPEDFSVLDLQELGFGTLEDGIYARGEWLDEGDNADIATRFLAATYEGWASCRDDADACVDLVVSKGSALGRSHQAWMMNEVNKLIWPSTNGIGTLEASAWDATIESAIEGEVLTSAPDDGAYRTDLNDAALALLEERGVDPLGSDWAPATVELTEGGK